MNRKKHWDSVYSEKTPGSLSWFQKEPSVSLALIRRTGIGPSAEIIDVGGGTSHLSACLIREGFGNLTVLDVSAEALSSARAHLGSSDSMVDWIESDVLDFEPGREFSLWHDRAVFHFLTSPEERSAYRRVLKQGLRPGGHLIIATFSLDGPSRCSGLDCVRYSPETLGQVLGEEFRLLGSETESHQTPSGGTQNFVYSWFQRGRALAEEPS